MSLLRFIFLDLISQLLLSRSDLSCSTSNIRLLRTSDITSYTTSACLKYRPSDWIPHIRPPLSFPRLDPCEWTWMWHESRSVWIGSRKVALCPGGVYSYLCPLWVTESPSAGSLVWLAFGECWSGSSDCVNWDGGPHHSSALNMWRARGAALISPSSSESRQGFNLKHAAINDATLGN